MNLSGKPNTRENMEISEGWSGARGRACAARRAPIMMPAIKVHDCIICLWMGQRGRVAE